MSALFGMRRIAALVIGLTTMMSAGSAIARDNCDAYAKLTLQQVKQARDKGCGGVDFRSARWSVDANKHRSWCRDVGPAKWRAELQLRNQILDQCKG